MLLTILIMTCVNFLGLVYIASTVNWHCDSTTRWFQMLMPKVNLLWHAERNRQRIQDKD